MTDSKNSTGERLDALEKRIANLETQLSVGNSHATHEADSDGKKLSVKEFVLEKKPKGDVQKTLAIALYLERYEHMASINIDDLVKYLRLAKEPVPSNPNDKINMNIRKGHMAEAGEKKENKKAWIVTNTGEQFVENGFKDGK